MTDDRDRNSESISISESALNLFSLSDDSLAAIVKAHDISVRDFMLLSLVSDQDCFNFDQLARALGLTLKEVTRSVNRLSGAGLLRPDENAPAGDRNQRVCATEAGKRMSRRILESIAGGG